MTIRLHRELMPDLDIQDVMVAEEASAQLETLEELANFACSHPQGNRVGNLVLGSISEGFRID
jgi:hypothetical protein